MSAIASNPPIPGKPIDPPPKETPDIVEKADDADSVAAETLSVLYRALNRFNYAKASVLAAGTTYYIFLAMFSLIALAYGIASLFGADQMAKYLTEAIYEAFPGLLGDEGIDPDTLRSVGQTASIVGLVVMVYAGGGAMVAIGSSIHLIYGAPPDPRGFIMKRVIGIAWMFPLGILLLLSLVGGSVIYGVSTRWMVDLGIEGTETRLFINAAGIVLILLADFLLMVIILGKFGGIRPPTRALLLGSIAGALVVQILRIPMAWILQFSIDQPEYGALAIPIGVMLVINLNAYAIFGAAALAAGFAEKDVALEDIVSTTGIEEAQVEPESPASEPSAE